MIEWAKLIARLAALPAGAELAALSKALREQAEKEIVALKTKLKECEANLKQCEAEKAALSEELDSLRAKPDLAPHDGLLWKKTEDGGYEQKPYCPKCREVMFDPFGEHEFWMCSPCNFPANWCKPPRNP